jgi:hypothetical protein
MQMKDRVDEEPVTEISPSYLIYPKFTSWGYVEELFSNS